MATLRYDFLINCSKPVVWRTLTESEKYKKWATSFSANSQFDGEWKQGAYMKFLDPDMGGTKALIAVFEPSDHILARHVSVLSKEGEESTRGEMAAKWIGTTEEYTLNDENGVTKLKVEIETHDDFVQMF